MGHRRIIVDASFIRGMSADGRPFGIMAERGDRIAIIDNLAFELCSTDNRDQWPAAQRKMMACRDALECWHNTGVMLRVEGERRQPFGDPLFEETTTIMRKLLTQGSPFTPDDLEARTEAERKTREGEAMPAMFRAFKGLEPLAESLAKQIEGKSATDGHVSQLCYNFVNHPENIRFLMAGRRELDDVNCIDDGWVTWHHYKALLAAFCEYLRRGRPVFGSLSESGQKRWINMKHDLEYLVSLAFADVIASRETTGEQNYLRRWLFGDSKQLVTLADF